MKTAVIYSSKAGFVKKYAEWIAQELQAELFEAGRFKADDFAKYDAVVYGGGLYAAGINGIKLIKANMDKLKDKKLAVFASGASPARPEVIEDVRAKNGLGQTAFFYMRGGFDYSKLSFIDKLLMNLMKSMLKRKKQPTPDERGMLEAYDRPVDFCRRENIFELVNFIKG